MSSDQHWNPRFFGARVTRVEDQRLLTGNGRYVDDLPDRDALHAAFLRSPYAHARTKTDSGEQKQPARLYSKRSVREASFCNGHTQRHAHFRNSRRISHEH